MTKEVRKSLTECGLNEITLTHSVNGETRSKRVRINAEKGRGTSCIAYQAEIEADHASGMEVWRPVILKEYYPASGPFERGADGLPVYQAGAIEHTEQRARFEDECMRQMNFISENPEAVDEVTELQGIYSGGDSLYTVMSTGGGSSWERSTKEPLKRILEIGVSVLHSLQYFHNAGLLHMDIKQDNVYVNRNVVRLFDFGSVLLMDREKSVVNDVMERHLFSISPAYAAPEVRKVYESLIYGDMNNIEEELEAIGTHSDLYSVATMLRKQIFGDRELSFKDLWQLDERFRNLSRRLIPMLEQFFAKAMADYPWDRYEIDEMIESLNEMIKLADPLEHPIESKPMSAVKWFVGRRDDIQTIHQHITGSFRPLYLTGEGGMGKSMLAVKYAEEYCSQFTFAYVTYNGSLRRTINAIKFDNYEETDLYTGKPKTEEVQYMEKLGYLREYGETLVLIIDNFDADDYNKEFDELVNCKLDDSTTNATILEELAGTGVHVIFTTRTEPQTEVTVPVEPMDEELLLELSKKIYTRCRWTPEDESLMREIIRIVGRHTMMVELIAASLQQKIRASLKTMYDLLHEEAYDRDSTRVTVGRSSERNTLEQHMKKVFRFVGLDEEKQQMLRLITLLPVDGIDIELFYALTEYMDEDERETSLQALRDLHMIAVENERVRMHPVMAAFAAKELGVDEENCEQFLNAVTNYYDKDQVQEIPVLLQVSETCEACIKRIADQLSQSELCTGIGRIENRIGRYERALTFELLAAQFGEEILQENNLYLAMIYNNVGSTYGELGDHEKALEYLLKALKIFEQVLPENHPYLTRSYNNVGVTYGALGEHNKALDYQRKALIVQEQVLPENHPDLATSYNSVGGTYGDLGDHKKALEYLLKALEIREQVLPENHPYLATSYDNVGGTYGALGDHEEALAYKQKALEIREQVLPEHHPDLAMGYNNVGGTYGDLGDRKKELEYFLKALEIWEQVLPEHHPDLATSYNNVGLTYGELGDHEKALEYLLQALEIREQVLPENHPDLANTHYGLAYTYLKLGPLEKALYHFEKAQEIGNTNN